MSPTVGQLLLGRHQVESVCELDAGLACGAASGGVSFLALEVPGGASAEVERLLREQDRYRIGAPGVARPLGAGLEDGRLVVVYERQHAETLHERIARGASEPALIGHALTSLAAALGPLHDQGIAFGVLRSELVRLGPTGVSVEGFALEALARALGTPPLHRAPEGGAATPATDLYALGSLVTELVIGRELRPADERPTPRACGVDVNDDVEAAISKAVARSAAARPNDVAGWADQLAQALLRPHVPLVQAPVAEPAAEAPPPWIAAPEEPVVVPAPTPAPAPLPAPPLRGPASLPPAKGGNALWVLALVIGVILILGGVGGLFAYSLLRTPPVTTPTPPSVATTLPVVPPPPPPPKPVARDAGSEPAADAGMSSDEPDASAPLPSVGTARVASGADTSSPLPLPAEVPVWGSDKALVTIVVFGDLECPHTRRAYRGLESLLRAFPDELRIAFRHRPLPIHSRAKDAARVAIGMRREHGDPAFWRFVSRAAGTSRDANKLELAAWVKDAGGQESRIETWLAQPEVESELARDLTLAGQFDVRETPTFFVNGLRIDGFTTYDDLKRAVDKELLSSRSVLALGTALSELYATRVRKNLMGLGKDVAERSCPPVAGSPVRGAADALVTIVEFSDFECPFCKRVQPTLDTLLARHGGDLRIVWKNFPLDHHPRSRPAAAFALEAFEKGGPSKFWKAHDLLFAAGDLGEPALEEIAGKLGMPPGALLDASRQRARDPKIDADARQGQKLGVRGTPAFFVNGRVLNGAQPLERFEGVVKEELESARTLVAGGTPRTRVYDALCGVR